MLDPEGVHGEHPEEGKVPNPCITAPTYQRGHVFLGGDAAYAHSRVGARGMNLGIEDAAAFARRFGEGQLDGYTASWNG